MNHEDRQRKLILACKRGDIRAMETLYRQYARSMFNVAYRIVNDFHFAEDVMQEAFLKAFERIGQFRGDASFGAWLKRITINESLNWVKKYGNRYSDFPANFSEEVEVDSAETEPPGLEPEKLLKAMQALNPQYRTIISLFYIEGYDYREIAEIMDISYQNARTMMTRAKKKLKKILENEK